MGSAAREFLSVDESYRPKLKVVAAFLDVDAPSRSKVNRLKSLTYGTDEYWAILADEFVSGRNARAPKPPTTKPDPLVAEILTNWFEISDGDIAEVTRTHSLSMAAEDVVGDLLEMYLASILEPEGWIWCSGSVVKATDFIYPEDLDNGLFTALQVKNRSNSENSSSKQVRNGTTIEKWHRVNARSGITRWDKFPHESRAQMSEEAFREFVQKHLASIKQV